MTKKKNKIIIFGSIFIWIVVLMLFLFWQEKWIFESKTNQSSVKNETISQEGPRSPISGLVCQNAKRRPIAVMLSGDKEARPLSGVSQADLVVEMPVTEGSITRLMAVFVCSDPIEIGSIRSARHDFIPLAMGLDAIYAHWGGSHFALEKLKTGILDNIDALPNYFSTFYRKSGIEAPHNGFTSINRLLSASEKLNYRLSSDFAGYPHFSESEILIEGKESKTITIDYQSPFGVSYKYNPASNSYFRFRDNKKEIDRNSNQQVETKNIVIMRAESKPLEDQYNDVQVEGGGKAEFYLDGKQIRGSWKKDKNDQKSKLYFYDDKGKEIRFIAGQVWVEIVEPERKVIYE